MQPLELLRLQTHSLAAVLLLAACSGETSDSKTSGTSAGGTTNASSGAGGSGGESSDGGTPQPNAACMSFCASGSVTCGGPNTEAATSSSITATGATGCSLSVVLPVSGTVEVELDCSRGEAGEACVVQGSSCLGSSGQCYAADWGRSGFSYFVQGCLNGSLACASN